MATLTQCPNHAGAFDCTPFCALCEGAQEVTLRSEESTTTKREKKTMIRKSDLTIDRNSEGAWRVSAVVGGYLETRRYYGYTKATAVFLFLDEFNEGN